MDISPAPGVAGSLDNYSDRHDGEPWFVVVAGDGDGGRIGPVAPEGFSVQALEGIPCFDGSEDQGKAREGRDGARLPFHIQLRS